MTAAIIVLDLDGVILKTNGIKHRAMLSLFSDYEEHAQRISEYILDRGGVPRLEKLYGILDHILGIEPDSIVVNSYLERYAIALEHELAHAPMVDGVELFIRSCNRPLYVSSSAPEQEVHLQLARRELSSHFSGIYGSDTPKFLALKQIARAHPHASVVFFGDSIGDLQSASAAGVAFVGVVNERDNFGQQATIKVGVMTEEKVRESILCAMRSRIQVNHHTDMC